MADYLTSKFKGKYRLLPELCLDTQDFPRNEKGEIDEDVEIYIACSRGAKISYWGLNESRRGVLIAYIPSVGRGRNVKKELKSQKIEIFNYDESAEEVIFHFLASDIEPVAKLLGARTSGAKISPLSTKNLPQNKDVCIPLEEMEEYKAVTGAIPKKYLVHIARWNKAFMTDILEPGIKKSTKNKAFSWEEDIRKLKLSRKAKEYIWAKGYWNQYLKYVEEKVAELPCN